MKAIWVPHNACVVTETNIHILTGTFIYAMCLDLIVMCLTAYKLRWRSFGHSRVGAMIFKDGLVYFIIT